jgi:pyruvate/2-oxoglutarate dehydrogenase complex dihydrolipoamide acyltransferase (E2) component
MTYAPIARERRHTLYFLEETRAFAPVFLDTEVDMTAVSAHRAAARTTDRRYSTVSYVLYAAARAMAHHPEANAAIRGRYWPRIARYDAVAVKMTLDQVLNGQRVVLSVIMPGLDQASLDEVQRQVDGYRAGDPARMPEFKGARLLHRLPWPLGPAAFRSVARPLRRRAEILGTVAVSSLGHRPVDAFHAVGGTTVTLGVGQVSHRPVVRDGAIQVAPVMRLSLTFDHRVIDGAEAADVLTDVKDGLERFPADAARAVAPELVPEESRMP